MHKQTLTVLKAALPAQKQPDNEPQEQADHAEASATINGNR
jgi:hypothetical protein